MWIFQYNPETMQQSAAWAPPVKFKQSKSVAKQMVACFFSKSDYEATIPLEDRKTVNSDRYINNCLSKVFEEWCKRCPRCGTQACCSTTTMPALTLQPPLDFLAENSLNLVANPPYSPDLASCDWFLFPFIKKQLLLL